jgi:hypothetical protein
MFHTTYGGDHMVATNCGSAKKKWETLNLCGLQKVEFTNKEGSFSITIHKLSTKHNGMM